MDSENSEKKRPKRTILVVDDEKSILLLFIRSFKDDDVHTCGSAEEALRIIDDLSFDMMVIDINLPGIDGCTLCRQIRGRYPDAFMLAITGYADKFEFAACKSAGFDGYFVKPISLKMLHQTIDEHFDKL